ncbi:unnamed protein product [Orchesella dallaii]|uniref:F-box domain-containing protein n=1 Tax=Orchesella dallaii TaxID=48710 RepID=A0ABP1RT34_9HEXA
MLKKFEQSSESLNCVTFDNPSYLYIMEKTGNGSNLPNELVLHILKQLSTKEDLLVCKLVNNEFASLVNQIAPFDDWNPCLMLYGIGEFGVGDRKTSLHTTFSSLKDTEDFYYHNKQLDSQLNPFSNSTVVVNFGNGEFEPNREHHLLNFILVCWGIHVKKFFYCPNFKKDPKQSPWKLLPQILYKMQNLHSLKIWYNDYRWISPDGRLRYLPVPKFTRRLVKLRELTIRSDGGDWGFRICKEIAVKHGEQIETLDFSDWLYDNRSWNLLTLFPNLKRFKCDSFFIACSLSEAPTPVQLVDTNCPKLTNLAITSGKCDSFEDLKNFLKLVGYFAPTLEFLTLGHGDDVIEILNLELREINSVFEDTPSVLFPKLSHLAIAMFDFTQRLPVERFLNMRFPVLKEVVLQDFDSDFDDQVLEKEEMRRICNPFWALMPPCVEKISIRALKSNESLGKRFPVTYECKRMGWVELFMSFESSPI